MRAALSVFWRSLQYWSDDVLLLIQMNGVWMLAMLLVIPGPPATAALLTVAHRMAHGGLADWQIARRAFQRYFWKSWAWALVNIAFAGLLAFNYTYYAQHTSGLLWTLVRVAWAAFALSWAAVQIYWWPLIMEMPGEPLIPALRNAARLALLNPLFTATLLIIVILFVAAAVALVIPAILMMSGVLALVANHATLDRLAAYREMQAIWDEEEPGRGALLEGLDRPRGRRVVTPRPPKPGSRRARRARRKSARRRKD
ncbi:MAG TPA: DUF624 domain-containing protein [Caldilineae bacterium]|nr:DUF624 domain-containing protein [Caldilineae bacterium]